MATTSRQECCICMDSFKNPRLISCNHSFCHKCLEDYVRANLRNGRFNCPLCRTSVTLPKAGVSGFESNAYIIDCDSRVRTGSDLKTVWQDGSEIWLTDTNIWQEDTGTIRVSETYACDICGPNSIACFRCFDCEENFCRVCSNVHEKLKATRHHKTKDLGTLDQKTKGTIRQRIFCEKHPEEEIKLVCQKCNVTMCVLCKAVNHDTHSSKTISDVAVQMQNILKEIITVCTEELSSLKVYVQTANKLEMRINDAEQQEIQAVECKQLQLKRLIDQEAATLTNKLKSIYGELKKQNVAFRSDVQTKDTLYFSAKENATKLISQGTDIEKVHKGLILQRQLAEAKSKPKPNPPSLVKKCFSPIADKQRPFGSFLGNVKDPTNVDQVSIHFSF
ncbi:hypothetical protein ACJMK2_002947 [Sinanodonta woodiana]|uniref:Uncharacterized protein n=1 Tax=Sinanodonta woodiana TaxID=1069815 RepID=A0ABD3XYE3_SINWO